MAFPVPDTIGLEIRGTLNGQDVENTFYYRYIAVPDESELQTLVNTVGEYWEEEALAVLPNQWVGREVYARDLAAPITVQASDSSISGLNGSGAGQTMPGFNTLAIARRSGLTGRSARGRIFWMGLDETWVNGNSITAGVADLMVDVIENMDDLVVTLGFTPVIVSRVQSGVTLTVPLTYPITQWLVTDYNVDTRRSRKPD